MFETGRERDAEIRGRGDRQQDSTHRTQSPEQGSGLRIQDSPRKLPVVVGISGASGATMARRAIVRLGRAGYPTIVTCTPAGKRVWLEELDENFDAFVQNCLAPDQGDNDKRRDESAGSAGGSPVCRGREGLSFCDSFDSLAPRGRAGRLPALSWISSQNQVDRAPHRFPLEVIDVEDIGASIASGRRHTLGMLVVPCSMDTLSAIAHGRSTNLLERAADVTLKEGRRLVIVPRENPLSAIHIENMLKLSRLGVRVVLPVPSFYLRPCTVDEVVADVVDRALGALGIQDLPEGSI